MKTVGEVVDAPARVSAHPVAMTFHPIAPHLRRAYKEGTTLNLIALHLRRAYKEEASLLRLGSTDHSLLHPPTNFLRF